MELYSVQSMAALERLKARYGADTKYLSRRPDRGGAADNSGTPLIGGDPHLAQRVCKHFQGEIIETLAAIQEVSAPERGGSRHRPNHRKR